MKAILITSIAAIAAATVAAAASGASSSAAGRCYAKEATVNGKSVIVNCGPASAKLTYKGKTYAFKGGTCLRTGKSVMLNLGTALVDDSHGNGGFSNFSITMLGSTLPAEITASFGKVSLAGSAKFSGIAVKGTFSGTAGSFGGVGVGVAKPFSGSWNCGDAIYNF